MAGVLSLGLGASGFDPLSHMDPFNGTYSVLLDHMDSSWDCSHAENPMEFSDNCNIDISEEFCFRGILFQSNFSIPCGLDSWVCTPTPLLVTKLQVRGRIRHFPPKAHSDPNSNSSSNTPADG